MELKKVLDLLGEEALGRDPKKLEDLDKFFRHLPPEVSVRQQKDHDLCVFRSSQVLGQLFDKIDLTDESVLFSLLKTLESYGYFRIALLTCSHSSDYEIVKSKWYDMTPLLPKAGEVGWKGILVHAFVKEEPRLFRISLRLLAQKLHFCSILSTLEPFQQQLPTIKRNGEKVAEKLLEMMRDIAHGEDSMFGVDSFLFNLLIPYSDDSQQIVMVDAIVQDLFKPIMLQKSSKDKEMKKLYNLIQGPIISNTKLQDVIISKVLQHMKVNAISKKRRHHADDSTSNDQEMSVLTLESILDAIDGGADFKELYDNLDKITLTRKTLKKDYISYWIKTLEKTVPIQGLTAKNAIVIINTSLTLLATSSQFLDEDLITGASNLFERALNNVGQEKQLKILEPSLVTTLCRKNSLWKLHEIYLRHYLKSISRTKRGKASESHLTSFKEFAKSFYKTYRGSFGSRSDSDSERSVKCSIVSILICAIEIGDQDTLDLFADTLSKIYSMIADRIDCLVRAARTGCEEEEFFIDKFIPRLINLFSAHRSIILPYLDLDPIEKILSSLIADIEVRDNGTYKKAKKDLYAELKTNLEALEEQEKSTDVYRSIINRQFNQVVDGNIASTSENSCCAEYLNKMRSFIDATGVLIKTCEQNVYQNLARKLIDALENCDPLDHQYFLHLILILESLISRKSAAIEVDILERISRALILIAKSVELGPSIHAFTSPGTHTSSKAIQCCTYSACIKVYTQIFIRYPASMTDQFITDAMQTCISSNLMQYSRYSIRLQRLYVQLATSIIGLLRSMCIGRKEDILVSSLPIFLAVFSNFIRCLINASDRQKLESNGYDLTNGHGNPQHEATEQSFEHQLELLALDISKTMGSLSYLRVKLIEYAPHLISAYIKDIQQASCPDFVRIHLNEGIFRIFNLVDAHQKERQEEVIESGTQRKTIAGRASGSLFEMIHSRLDQASREIFRDMHENYNKFHRYVGKC